MQNKIPYFRKKVNADALYYRTMELLDLEYKQTFSCYHASAKRTFEMLCELGFSSVEKISFPADGKTAYQDKITPLGWEASIGKAAILEGKGFKKGEVIGDYQNHPFHLIKGSTATRKGGEVMQLFSFEDLLAGKDVKGGLILNPPNALFADFKTILDKGARGIIADYSVSPEEYPEGISWYNAYTEGSSWHTIAGHRDFIAFGVTPSMSRRLRESLAAGNVLLHVECDGRRFESTVDVVTATVPGKRKEEFWIFAHLYEPLSNDNSSGVSAAMETARLIMEEGTPEFTSRRIFGLEMYGFAAYASTRGKDLSGQVIGGINLDAIYLRKEWGISCNASSPTVPFFGNPLFEILAQDLAKIPGMPKAVYKRSFPLMYEDDTFLGDSTTRVPTLWPFRTGKRLWHNSLQVISYVEKEAFADGAAIHTAIVDAIVNPKEKHLERVLENALAALEDEKEFFLYSPKDQLQRRYEILRQDIASFARFFPEERIAPLLDALREKFILMQKELVSLPPPPSPTRENAAKWIPARMTVGLPYDLTLVPEKERRNLRLIYSPVAALLSAMDGETPMDKVISKVEFEIRRVFPEKELAGLMEQIEYLGKYGYISWKENPEIK